MIPTDTDILAMVPRVRAGEFDQYTRERVGGSTLTATKGMILARAGHIECALCARPMLNTSRTDRPEIGHMVPAAYTPSGAGGWLVRSAPVAMLGHAAMTLMCGRCNLAASDRLILPSMLVHSDHYVTGAAPKPMREGIDAHDVARRDRLGW